MFFGAAVDGPAGGVHGTPAEHGLGDGGPPPVAVLQEQNLVDAWDCPKRQGIRFHWFNPIALPLECLVKLFGSVALIWLFPNLRGGFFLRTAPPPPLHSAAALHAGGTRALSLQRINYFSLPLSLSLNQNWCPGFLLIEKKGRGCVLVAHFLQLRMKFSVHCVFHCVFLLCEITRTLVFPWLGHFWCPHA